MRWPVNPANNPNKLSLFQTVMVPKAGRKFVFTKVPGSYVDVGKVYTCSGYPNTADRWSSHDIYITCVETGSGTFHRLMSWENAEWHYVD